MPDEFAAIESQYNEIYEKRHKRLEERIAQLEPAEQPEEAVTDPADEVPEETTDEAETVQPDPADEAPQEIAIDTEEAAA